MYIALLALQCRQSLNCWQNLIWQKIRFFSQPQRLEANVFVYCADRRSFHYPVWKDFFTWLHLINWWPEPETAMHWVHLCKKKPSWSTSNKNRRCKVLVTLELDGSLDICTSFALTLRSYRCVFWSAWRLLAVRCDSYFTTIHSVQHHTTFISNFLSLSPLPVYSFLTFLTSTHASLCSFLFAGLLVLITCFIFTFYRFGQKV